MGLKRIFLQLPLNSQISISLILIIFCGFFLLTFLGETFSTQYLNYILLTKKEYYLNMEQNILESNIFFVNLCLFEYEYLIKLFNNQLYLYLKNETILLQFAIKNNRFLSMILPLIMIMIQKYRMKFKKFIFIALLKIQRLKMVSNF